MTIFVDAWRRLTGTRPTETTRAFDAVHRELDRQRDAGLHTNAGVAVFQNGELVLEVAHPEPEFDQPRPMFRAFSAGKPLAAATIWRLLDAGKIELDAPVARFWPEFAQAGKSGITVRHVLTHTSGLALDTTRSDIDWMDWGRVTDALAQMTPSHESGTLMQYHAFTFGWLVAEIAARVTGQPFDALFDSEVRQPLGLHDTHYVIQRGDDTTLDRVVDVKVGRDFDDVALPSKMDGLLLLEVSFPAGSCITTARDLAKFYDALVSKSRADADELVDAADASQGHEVTYGVALDDESETPTDQSRQSRDGTRYNRDAVDAAADPSRHSSAAGAETEPDATPSDKTLTAVSGHVYATRHGSADAASVGARNGWLSDRTRRLIYETHAETFDLDESRFSTFGLGVAFADHQPNRMAAPPGTSAFGHGGLGTCIGWADPEHGVSAAILTDTALPEPMNHRRHNRISAAIRKELGLPTGWRARW